MEHPEKADSSPLKRFGMTKPQTTRELISQTGWWHYKTSSHETPKSAPLIPGGPESGLVSSSANLLARA
jgi:hypothetical protein